MLEELSKLNLKCIPKFYGVESYGGFEAIKLEYIEESLNEHLKGKSLKQFLDICA